MEALAGSFFDIGCWPGAWPHHGVALFSLLHRSCRCLVLGLDSGSRYFPSRVPPSSVHSADLAPHAMVLCESPSCVGEVLLVYFLHCLARGGMSLTAASFVYDQLWHSTMVGTLYATRTNFVSKLCVALLTWSTLRMMMRSGLDICTFTWYLRPHVAPDFADLLVMGQKAFNLLAASTDADCGMH